MNKREWTKSLLMVMTIVFGLWLLRVLVFTPVIIKGESMGPTLHDGARVIALKNIPAERFDIVTFPAPDEPGKNYIKRIIGLPGDEVAFRNDTLYINGKKTAEPYLEEYKNQLTDGEPLTYDFTLEEIIGTRKIPQGKLFVMGDNRRISKDSRIIGVIDQASLLGDVKWAIWPLNTFGALPIISHFSSGT